MKYFVCLNRNHFILWSGYERTEDDAWEKVKESTSIVAMSAQDLQKGRYGLRLVEWPE